MRTHSAFSVRGTAGLLLGGGAGERLGLATPKAFVPVAGRKMLEWSLLSMVASSVVETVVLVVPRGLVRQAEALISDSEVGHVVSSLVTGGATRQESVRLGLAALVGTEVVLCHDAARPLASPELFRRVWARLTDASESPVDGVVPAVRSADTVKRVRDGMVVETIPRAEVGLTQTPQAFMLEALSEVHRQNASVELSATDDASLLEDSGRAVAVVEGEPSNFKITSAADLRRAEEMLRGPSLGPARPGR